MGNGAINKHQIKKNELMEMSKITLFKFRSVSQQVAVSHIFCFAVISLNAAHRQQVHNAKQQHRCETYQRQLRCYKQITFQSIHIRFEIDFLHAALPFSLSLGAFGGFV